MRPQIEKALKSYLARHDVSVDVVIINDVLPGLGVTRRFNPAARKSEKCLLVHATNLGLAVTNQPTITANALQQLENTAFPSPKYARALRLHYGLEQPGHYYSFPAIARVIGRKSPQYAQQLTSDALARLAMADCGYLTQVWQVTSAAVSWLLEGEELVTLSDLQKLFVNLQLARNEEVERVIPLLYLIQDLKLGVRLIDTGPSLEKVSRQNQILPQALMFGKPAVIVDLKTASSTGPSLRQVSRDYDHSSLIDHLAFVKDPEVIEGIVEFYFETRASELARAYWEFEDYQACVRNELGILMSPDRLRQILEKNNLFVFAGEAFYARDLHGVKSDQIRQLLKTAGPLHLREIASETGLNEATARAILIGNSSFVLIGRGIFDLLEKRPELERVPFPRKTIGRRRSWCFASVYGLLRRSKEPLTFKQIMYRLRQKGYGWKQSAIENILNHDPNHCRFFRTVGNGRYALKLPVVL